MSTNDAMYERVAAWHNADLPRVARTAEVQRARRAAVDVLCQVRTYRGRSECASSVFDRAAEICAAAGAADLNEGDLEGARAFAAAWAMLRRRQTRAANVRPVSVRLGAVA